ncbi:MAG: hemolysin III family protein [Erysipelotrichaceae bacterium]|nr:hemolysin III family protein [Erysipelotrichaceae bacterium]
MTALKYSAANKDTLYLFRPKDPLAALSHFIGFLAAIALTPVLLIRAASSDVSLLGMSVFLWSAILLYGASSAWHSFDISPRINLVLKRLDHLSIFLLIAGSYTPFCLEVIPGLKGKVILIAVWTLAVLGMAIKYFAIYCPRWVSSLIYIGMGWVALFSLPELFSGLGLRGFLWLLSGGISYTIGGIIYGLKIDLFHGRHPAFGNHELFHLFVLGGTLCHYLCLYFFVCI